MSRLFLGELIGTFLLVLFGCGSVAAAVYHGAFSSLFEVALAWGIGIAIAIFASRSLSPSHLNPAVSIAFYLSGHTSLKELPSLVCGQFIGAIGAAVLLFVWFEPSIETFENAKGFVRGDSASFASAMAFGEFFPNPDFPQVTGMTPLKAALCEGGGTAVLMFVIYRLIEKQEEIDNTTPLFIGLTVSLLIILIAPFTQAGFNPARDFGPRLVAYFAGWGNAAFPAASGSFFTVYILAPILGASLAGLIERSRLKLNR